MDRRLATLSTLLLIIVNQASRIHGCCCITSAAPYSVPYSAPDPSPSAAPSPAPCPQQCLQPCPQPCPPPCPPTYGPYPPSTTPITDILLQLVSGLKSPAYPQVTVLPGQAPFVGVPAPVAPFQTVLPPTVVAPGYCCPPCCCKPDTATIPINLEVVPSVDCSKSSKLCVMKDPSCRSCCSCCC